MRRQLIHGLVLAVMLLLPAVLTAGSPARDAAGQAGLNVQLQPRSGPPGTMVTVYGAGAPAGARVDVLYAPYTNQADCLSGRNATSLGETLADASGRFALSHVPDRARADVAGVTFLARLAGSQATSNLECFVFEAAAESRFFPETGKWVRDEFMRYWQRNGGLEIFGYPLTSEILDDGRITQYFERSVFALHPNNQPPWNVLLRLLGAEVTANRRSEAPFQRAQRQAGGNCLYFEPTGHNVCGNFRVYWEQLGGLPVYGYPLSEQFQERVAETGQVYTVQYFERQRFELHPGAWPQRHDVLLGRLGAQVLPGGGTGENTARIEIPAEGSRQTLPLRLLARTNQAGQQLVVELRWQDGTSFSYNRTTIQGEDGRGLLIDNLDFDVEGIPPMPPTQPATLEIREQSGRVLARSRITMIGRDDPESMEVRVFWILPFDQELFRSVPVRVPRTQMVGTAVLEALLWGPSPPNLAGFVTALPTPQEVLSYAGREPDWGPRVTLRRLTIENGVATADFSKEMRAYGGGAARVSAIREQITRTLMQFPTVRQVRIAVEGQTEGVLEP